MVWKLAYRNRAEGLHATDCDYAKLQGMTYARAHLVDAENGGFYHCISRCVRRGWSRAIRTSMITIRITRSAAPAIRTLRSGHPGQSIGTILCDQDNHQDIHGMEIGL